MRVVEIIPPYNTSDFEVGTRHNLERIIVMNPNGIINENYVSKVPSALVEQERGTLESEKQSLEIVLQKWNQLSK